MNSILKLVTKLAGNKIVKIVLEILEGVASKYLDKAFEYVKEGVALADNISSYVKANSAMSKEEIKVNIKTIYNYDLTDAEIEDILKPKIKGIGKYLIAYNYIIGKLKAEGKDFSTVIINLLIEIAVAKFSNK